jgi:endonuclease/exonuclease/phosphatase family metal-dependent hydrolase
MRFSVLTLNLWNINEPLASRFSALAAGLQVLRPDIVCLQEVARDPRSARRQSEFVAEMCNLTHAVDNDGLSILSRYPIVRSHSAALPEAPDDPPRQVLLAETLIDSRPLLVGNTHLAWRPEMVAERKAQVESLLPAIARFASAGAAKAKLLCGDFNDDPDSPAVRLLLDSGEGFHDVYAECHHDSPGFTWSLQNPYVDPSTNRDQRIDYIFATDEIESKDCSVVFDGGDLNFASDHFGVFCHLAFRGRSRLM